MTASAAPCSASTIGVTTGAIGLSGGTAPGVGSGVGVGEAGGVGGVGGVGGITGAAVMVKVPDANSSV